MKTRIAFLAVSQAHQFLHWLPAALRLGQEPDVEVTVLGSTRAGLDFIRSYDPDRRLRLEPLWTPFFSRGGLFTPPARRLALMLNAWRIARFPTVVTTETTSSLLRQVPGFQSRQVLIKHGAGDREGSYNPKHASFDLILVNGEKHRDELIQRGLVRADACLVTGNAKLELVRPPIALFSDNKPVALYNPHFDRRISSWFEHGRALVEAMEQVPEWNFVVAPHVKLRDGPDIRSSAPNVLIDRGSARSIDMTYTQAADVYVGDVSSQVYEFVVRPRPCIFLNLDRVDWRDQATYAHWNFGQVIESVDELGPALRRARLLQPQYEDAQWQMRNYSMDVSQEPSSERQARAILTFARRQSG